LIENIRRLIEKLMCVFAGLAKFRDSNTGVILVMNLKRILFLTHRWLGIPLCLLFLVWFVSGVVMMYTRLPGLDAAERLQGLTPLKLDTLRITAADACARAGLTEAPRRVRLAMWQQRPAWFVLPKGEKWRVVFADDGTRLASVTPEQAATIAQAYLRAETAPQFVATVNTIDQWTLSNSLNLHRPLHRFRFADENETELYVSQITGEVVQKSTRRERLLGWIGVIPHYGEFLIIRQYVGAWRQLMIWLAVFGTALAITGIWAGLKRYRRSGYRMGDGSVVKTPYQGWMKWHHVGGLIFGAVTLTWIVSGMLYLNPGGTRNPSALDTNTTMSPYNVGGVRASTSATAQQSAVFSGGALQPELFTLSSREALRQLPADAVVREIELLRFDGKPYLLCWDDTYTSWLVTADATASGDEVRAQFPQEMLLAKARQAMPNGQMIESALLTDSDLYYLAIGAVAPRRLPMLRVKFDDPDKTWLYIDPHTGSIARRYDNYGRGWRFVMNGLHTWDFLRYRPLWDIFMLVMCAGGVLLSGSAIVLTLRRLGVLKPARAKKTLKEKTQNVAEEITV
jgi:uncharacterized iron-regulated membrane protein